MGLHKLTAGDGYLYLIRQVAAADDSGRGRGSLADYYSAKGEAPGRWMGRGLAALAAPDGRDAFDPLVARLWSVPEGSQVTEEQMKALFGEGLHPSADAIAKLLIAKGLGHQAAVAAARLGRPFRINTTESEFTARVRAAYAAHNAAIGAADAAAIDEQTKAGLRTDVGREMFTEHYERAPADERELSGFIARQTRSQTSAVAGYDLTFTPVKSVSVLWAIAPRHIAEVIEDCHHQAVAHMERRAGRQLPAIRGHGSRLRPAHLVIQPRLDRLEPQTRRKRQTNECVAACPSCHQLEAQRQATAARNAWKRRPLECAA